MRAFVVRSRRVASGSCMRAGARKCHLYYGFCSCSVFGSTSSQYCYVYFELGFCLAFHFRIRYECRTISLWICIRVDVVVCVCECVCVLISAIIANAFAMNLMI